ncbi:hypothetical protein [Salinibius halmophilus]|uniref:hypothetical protein n=1 Tax=Salinibius halmophilus TaxID=1853216 RepID=UPI000E66BAB1|nr:hypothetical protein [Salinibius halmophilus]
MDTKLSFLCPVILLAACVEGDLPETSQPSPTIALNPLPVTDNMQLLFTERFDDQPDWTSTMHTNDNSQETRRGDILPEGWSMIYQGTTWSPETGYPDNHASLEILERNADKALGGYGKSAVFWRESHSLGWNNWASDAQFLKVFDNHYESLYVEFWIRFSPNWYQRDKYDNWASKVFRAGAWNRSGSIYNGREGAVGPRLYYNYKRDSYGVRNVLSLYPGPPGQEGPIESGIGGSRNYRGHTDGMGINGTNPEIPNQVGEGFLKDVPGAVTHEQAFGKAEHWTRMSFYMKLNSAPGVADGIFRQWLNGVQFHNDEAVTWISSGAKSEDIIGWNYFGIGGNDFFQAYPNELRFEDWYAIDDLVVYTDK